MLWAWLQEQELSTTEITALITAIAAAINVLAIAYQAWRRSKPEVKKLEAEGESELQEAVNVNLEGAKISSAMLVQRIEELKQDIASERAARKQDAEYFRRRIKDIEKESRDNRLWAARLAKQVIEAGKTPVPFISSLNDTDPLISAIAKEQEELEVARTTRQEEIRKANE
jgi:hypothetical protein